MPSLVGRTAGDGNRLLFRGPSTLRMTQVTEWLTLQDHESSLEACGKEIALLPLRWKEGFNRQDDGPRRRLEQLRPTLAAELLRGLAQPVPQAALALLQLAEREVAVRAPQLPWAEARQVRAWLQVCVAGMAAEPGVARDGQAESRA